MLGCGSVMLATVAGRMSLIEVLGLGGVMLATVTGRMSL